MLCSITPGLYAVQSLGTRPREPDESSAQSDLCCSLELYHYMLISPSGFQFQSLLSAVNKADFITSITSQSRLKLMALTETWIKLEDNATPAALSNNFFFSHTPRLTGRGGGTGLLITNNWKFTPLSTPSIKSSFESHSVTITYPLKIHFVVVYRPPGPLVNFVL